MCYAERSVAPCATDHGVEVGEATDLCGVLVELLVEGIGDVVGGVSGDEENTVPHPRQQHCQTAAGGGGRRQGGGSLCEHHTAL